MGILQQIDHLVVVMFENRSLDHMLGGLYRGAVTAPAEAASPALILPPGGPAVFDGLRPGLSNPSNAAFFQGGASTPVAAGTPVDGSTVPNPDPQETFEHVTYQLYGPEGAVPTPNWPMQGFLLDYATTTAGSPAQIMQCRSASQVPVLSALARNYAVSDAWFASVPSQTWPNRAFAHAGTSNGRVDNGEPPDPLQWNVPTIFNVLKAVGESWGVYSDAILLPSLTRTMFPALWDPLLDGHFHGFSAFADACASDTLPRYSFIEPSFLLDPNDQHPPHDVNAGESFLHAIWTAVSASPGWSRTLLVVTYDEHGGCFDHVLPPSGAAPPDPASRPGDQGFGFDRFGVRVPTVVISPWIAPGTVFRSPTATPYDHTSILATLRDWIPIPPDAMLPSARIAAAPTLAQLPTLSAPRTQTPMIAPPGPALSTVSLSAAPNDLQRSLVSGAARRYGLDPATALGQIKTRQHAVDFFKRRAPRPQ